jgi:hypothetical protein
MKFLATTIGVREGRLRLIAFPHVRALSVWLAKAGKPYKPWSSLEDISGKGMSMKGNPITVNGMRIQTVGDDPVVRFAADELARCLEKMTGVKHNVGSGISSSEEGICLGTLDDLTDLGISGLCGKSESEDTIALKTIGRNCFMTGSNKRSVLFAAYRYLELLGAAWLWPGEDGEVLPEIKKARIDGFDIVETASYRHRGICIEGAVSPAMVIDFIDWMAKRRLNEFFLQFKTSQYFYNRYYARHYNPLIKPSPELSVNESLEADARVISELKKRGMTVERVGHGWTCEALGIRGLGWDVAKEPIPEGTRKLMAFVNGRRGLFGDIAVNTELCYSNPEAFKALVDHVVQYAVDHPEVDILHFWLSDGMNNQCECPDCQKLTPSDWYAKLINSIAHRLGEIKCKTLLVFLCYTNTLWAPIKGKVEDKYGNIIFMFAPITRCYLHPLADPKCSGSTALVPPPRNRTVPPKTNQEYVQLLRGWQRSLQSDSFLFDYHFWDIFGLDFLGGDITRVLWHDLHDLQELGLDGLLSCQTLRAFYPNGIPMAILAETLWDREVNPEDIKDHYLKVALGEDAPFVSDYLHEIYSFIDPDKNYGHDKAILTPKVDEIRELLIFVRECRPRLEMLARAGKGTARARTAFLLLHHNAYVALMLEALIHNSKGGKEDATRTINEGISHFLSAEDEIAKFADIYLISNALNRVLSKIRSGIVRSE